MERNVDDVIHFMKQVQNPEWMIDLVTNLKTNNNNAYNYIESMLKATPVNCNDLKSDLEKVKMLLTR